MKLTKGKLSKILNKKKQSHKKKNHKRKSHKRNTFRNSKRINLANKTLKNFKIGGDPDEVSTNVDQIVPSVVEDDSDNKETLVSEEIVTPAEEIVTPAEEIVTPAEEIVTPAEEIVTPAEEIVTPAEEIVTPAEETVTQAEEIVTPPEEIVTPGEEINQAQELADAEAAEATKKAQELADAEADSKVQEVATPVSETSTEIPSNEIITDEVNKSINILADLVASKIAAKIQGNSSSPDVQNGFKSVDNIANVLGSSKGGSKYKTKRFRLTKKRKTRRSK